MERRKPLSQAGVFRSVDELVSVPRYPLCREISHFVSGLRFFLVRCPDAHIDLPFADILWTSSRHVRGWRRDQPGTADSRRLGFHAARYRRSAQANAGGGNQPRLRGVTFGRPAVEAGALRRRRGRRGRQQ